MKFLDQTKIYVRSGNVLEPRYARGQDSDLFGRLSIPVGSGLSGWVTQNELPIFNGNPAVESAYLLDGAQTTGMKSALAVPLIGAGYSAVLTLYHRDKEAFSREQLNALTALGPEILVLLTSYGNSRTEEPEAVPSQTPSAILEYLGGQLEACQLHPQPISLMILDDVRSTRLSADSPQRSAAIAAAMQAAFPEDHVWGRLRGSQYAAVIPGVAQHALAGRVQTLKLALQSNLAIGAATYPGDGDHVERLLARAYQRLQADRAECPSFAADLRSLQSALAAAPVPAPPSPSALR